MNLIAAQDAHIERAPNARPCRIGNSMGGLTLLRRKLSSIRASRKKYIDDLKKMGFPRDQIRITLQDAEDVAILEHNSEE